MPSVTWHVYIIENFEVLRDCICSRGSPGWLMVGPEFVPMLFVFESRLF